VPPGAWASSLPDVAVISTAFNFNGKTLLSAYLTLNIDPARGGWTLFGSPSQGTGVTVNQLVVDLTYQKAVGWSVLVTGYASLGSSAVPDLVATVGFEKAAETKARTFRASLAQTPDSTLSVSQVVNALVGPGTASKVPSGLNPTFSNTVFSLVMSETTGSSGLKLTEFKASTRFESWKLLDSSRAKIELSNTNVAFEATRESPDAELEFGGSVDGYIQVVRSDGSNISVHATAAFGSLVPDAAKALNASVYLSLADPDHPLSIDDVLRVSGVEVSYPGDAAAALGKAKLTTFELGFAGSKLALMNLKLSVADSWTLIPNAISVKNADLEWSITVEDAGKKTQTALKIDGSIELGDTTEKVTLTYTSSKEAAADEASKPTKRSTLVLTSAPESDRFKFETFLGRYGVASVGEVIDAFTISSITASWESGPGTLNPTSSPLVPSDLQLEIGADQAASLASKLHIQSFECSVGIVQLVEDSPVRKARFEGTGKWQFGDSLLDVTASITSSGVFTVTATTRGDLTLEGAVTSVGNSIGSASGLQVGDIVSAGSSVLQLNQLGVRNASLSVSIGASASQGATFSFVGQAILPFLSASGNSGIPVQVAIKTGSAKGSYVVAGFSTRLDQLNALQEKFTGVSLPFLNVFGSSSLSILASTKKFNVKSGVPGESLSIVSIPEGTTIEAGVTFIAQVRAADCTLAGGKLETTLCNLMNAGFSLSGSVDLIASIATGSPSGLSLLVHLGGSLTIGGKFTISDATFGLQYIGTAPPVYKLLIQGTVSLDVGLKSGPVKVIGRLSLNAGTFEFVIIVPDLLEGVFGQDKISIGHVAIGAGVTDAIIIPSIKFEGEVILGHNSDCVTGEKGSRVYSNNDDKCIRGQVRCIFFFPSQFYALKALDEAFEFFAYFAPLFFFFYWFSGGGGLRSQRAGLGLL
jgi:hypothetical protein